ncbi:MAG TPA: hypothetical protein VGO60_19010 [Iamia sp.]|nr:hypothetical protein [Iamia sp.]
MGLTRRRALLAVAAPLLLLVAACTGDESDDAAPRTGEGVNESTTTDDDATTTEVPDASGDEPTTTGPPAEGPAPTAPGLDAPIVAPGPIGGSRFVARVEPDPDPEGGGRLVVEDRETRTERVVADRRDATPSYPQVSADGQVVAWSESTGDSDATNLVIRTGGALDVRADAPNAGCARWMADGRLLATVFTGGDTGHLVLVSPADGSVEDLPIELEDAVCAAPAGADHVVVPVVVGEPFGPGGYDLVRYSLDGRHGEQVGHLPGGCSTNAIATDPAGTRAAVSLYCDDTSRNAIWVVDLDGGARPLVAENEIGAEFAASAQYWDPAWSADGTVIAYQRSEPGPDDERNISHIWLVTVATGATALLGEQAAFAPGLSLAG